jgi:putative DNA primase/helicase
LANWLLRLRRKGVAVLLIHNAGVNGKQRGTSRREDALDLVIGLRRPADYSSEQGARFEVHIEKARTLVGVRKGMG